MKPLSFEAVKLALKGNVLTLAIHPSETPPELWQSPVGTRYGVALVELNEEQTAFEDEALGERVFKLFGVRCRDKQFQRWLHAMDEETARTLVKKKLGIASSKEIRDNPVIREKFLELMKDYDNAISSREGPRSRHPD